MASHAALAPSRIPTSTRLLSKNSYSFPTQCFSKVFAFFPKKKKKVEKKEDFSSSKCVVVVDLSVVFVEI